MTTINASRAARFAAAGCAAILAAMGVAGPARAAASDVPDEQITAEVVTMNGSGCPMGSTKPNIREDYDNTGFRIQYPNFRSDATSATPNPGSVRNCQVAVRVDIPQGFTLAVARADYHGLLSLAPGATGTQVTNYYFQGNPNNNFVDHRFTGPNTGSWNTTDIAAVAVFAPCSKSVILNINTRLIVTSPSGKSFMSLRKSDADLDTLIQLGWKRC